MKYKNWIVGLLILAAVAAALLYYQHTKQAKVKLPVESTTGSEQLDQ